LVLMGGVSEEREVSLRSGHAVVQGLIKAGYEVGTLDLNRDNIDKIKEINPDVVFIALHGQPGEDGTIQGYLELLGIPYTNSGVAASAICMHKGLAKKIFMYEGIPTADFITIKEKEFSAAAPGLSEMVVARFGLPVVIKAATQGSSIGTYIVKQENEIIAAMKNAFAFSNEVIVEKFIDGIQLTVSVLGNESPACLPIIEITSENEFYDYESKYTPGMCQHIIPARISDEVSQEVKDISIKAFKALDCRGVARIDFMVDKEGHPYVLEVNTIPGLTEMSLVPDAARAAGISFEQLVDQMVKLAMSK
jgi:D-alanine-D-alanine ligase